MDKKTIFRKQGSASGMIWAGLTSCGLKAAFVFVLEGIKVKKKTYLDLLKTHVLPLIKSHHQNHLLTLMQEGAPAHTSDIVQAWC